MIEAKKLFDLTGKVAVETGGSSGLGQAIALGIASCGADVVVVYNTNLKGAEETVQGATSMGREAIAVKADVSQSVQVNSIVEQTLDRFGKIDISFNIPGINIRKPIDCSPPKSFIACSLDLESHLGLLYCGKFTN